MAYHDETLWEIQDEIKEIHRKIALLLEESNSEQRKVLLEAQRDLAEWEQQHVHSIRMAFEPEQDAGSENI